MKLVSFACVLTFLLSVLPTVVNTQNQGCNFKGLDIEKCLNEVENSISLDTCCIVLNQAIEAGFHCLCSFLSSSTYNSPLSTSRPLPLSKCYISVPALTQCQALVPIILPPAAPAFPVLLAPDIPMEPPKASDPNASLFPPLPLPQEARVWLNSTTGENSTMVKGQPLISSSSAPNLTVSRSECKFSRGYKIRSSIESVLFLVVTIYACMH